MAVDIVDRIFDSTWVAFTVPALVLLVFAELGFRVGLHLFERHDEARKSTIGGIQGAILGLLGLLLGFTFALATSRFELRRDLVVQQSNAIGTAYLRASLLPEAHVAPVQDLLRGYVAILVEYYPRFDDPAARGVGLAKIADAERGLWEHAVAAAREAPTPIVATFVTAINETFDVMAMRLAVGAARIPGSVWVLLLIVAALGCVTSSYAAGSAGVRSSFSSLILPALIAVVIMLIFDISRPRIGFIRVSQQSILDLQKSIARPGG
jgi:hypothetical protein